MEVTPRPASATPTALPRLLWKAATTDAVQTGGLTSAKVRPTKVQPMIQLISRGPAKPSEARAAQWSTRPSRASVRLPNRSIAMPRNGAIRMLVVLTRTGPVEICDRVHPVAAWIAGISAPSA